MIWAAIFSAAGALVIASFTLFITAPWLRQKLTDIDRSLDVCERERVELRRRLELFTGALLRTLPESERFELLASISEALEPERGVGR